MVFSDIGNNVFKRAEGNVLPLIKGKQVHLLENPKQDGEFQLLQFDNVNRLNGVNESSKSSFCGNCSTFLSTQIDNVKCSSCIQGSVLDNSQCVAFCPVGKQNIDGFCFKCGGGICNSYNEYFDVRKTAPNTIEVTQLKEVDGLLSPLSSNFSQNVSGAVLDTDYTLDI